MPRGPKISIEKMKVWLADNERGSTLDEIAREYHASKSSVSSGIKRARVARAFETAAQDSVSKAFALHQDDLMGEIGQLMESLAIPDIAWTGIRPELGLAAFEGETTQGGEWDIGGSVVIQIESSMPKSLHLKAEGSVIWDSLVVHLGKRDRLWSAITEWKANLLEEMTSRVQLNRLAANLAQNMTGVLIVSPSSRDMPQLTLALPSFVREIVTKMKLGLLADSLQGRVTYEHNELYDTVSNRTLAKGTDKGQLDLGILEKLIAEVASRPKAEKAACDHKMMREVDTRTQRVLDEYLLTHHVRGTCRVCENLKGV